MIDRREFLKLGGATAFAALFAGCERLPKKIVPFVIPPDDHTLGESLWYASLCRACPAGCGILVRNSEGRARKIEGNPLHPVNRGKLCARGQAALQALYHPERLGKPLRASGPRGSGAFREIPWEEAIGELLAGLKKVRAERPESLLLLTEPMRGHRNLVAARFMTAFGSPHRLAWDPFGQDALLSAGESVLGVRDIPEYDIAGAAYVLSLSGDFLETWVSPVHYGRAYGRMRNERETVRGKLVHFGSRLSMTAAAADLFLPALPGTEGYVALGIAHVMVREKLTPEAAASGLWGAGLSAWTPVAVGKKSGTPPTALAGVAREFARNRPAALAIAGTAAGSATNGAFNHAATALLNVLSGNIGKPGGISFPDRAAAFGRAGAEAPLLAPPPESGHPRVREAIERMRAGTFRMALLSGTANPAFTLPAPLRFGEALGKVPFVVSFAAFLDETAALSDLVLPVPTFLEEWGDDAAPAGHAGDALTLAQPAVEPFRDARSMADVLLAAAAELGGPFVAALPWRNFRECLEKAHGGTAAFEEALRSGGLFAKGPPRPPRHASKAARPSLPKPADPVFEGDPGRYPLILHLFPSIAHYDGRGANLSWLQELPDPVSTAVWRSWVELNPATAASLAISDGDGVVVESPFGKIEAHVALHPGLMPGVAAMPLGQGHARYGKNAAERGANPLTLLPVALESATGAPAWQATRVSVKKAPVAGRLVRAAHPEGQWKVGNLM